MANIQQNPPVEELKVTHVDGTVRYIYIAKIDGKWVDLAPYGNRLPSRAA